MNEKPATTSARKLTRRKKPTLRQAQRTKNLTNTTPPCAIFALKVLSVSVTTFPSPPALRSTPAPGDAATADDVAAEVVAAAGDEAAVAVAAASAATSAPADAPNAASPSRAAAATADAATMVTSRCVRRRGGARHAITMIVRVKLHQVHTSTPLNSGERQASAVLAAASGIEPQFAGDASGEEAGQTGLADDAVAARCADGADDAPAPAGASGWICGTEAVSVRCPLSSSTELLRGPSMRRRLTPVFVINTPASGLQFCICIADRGVDHLSQGPIRACKARRRSVQMPVERAACHPASE